MNNAIVIVLAAVLFSAVAAAMAIGLIFRGKCIRGSCGGEAVYGPGGELLNCDTCPVRKDPERLARGSSQGTRVPASKSS
jgi:hypothetical protein